MRSNYIQEILDRITPEEHEEFKKQILEWDAHHRWMEENGFEYSTDTSPSLQIIKEYGFNPIAITSFYLEETFIFRTEKEASAAYKKLEKELHLVSGWWYGERKFYKDLAEATAEGEFYECGHPKIYKL
jgi:hypothetical protein